VVSGEVKSEVCREKVMGVPMTDGGKEIAKREERTENVTQTPDLCRTTCYL